MAEQVLIQFRVDKELKQDVAEICDALGTDMSTVFRMCMKQMKIVRGIPFSTRLPEQVVTRAEALEAFEKMRRQEPLGLHRPSLKRQRPDTPGLCPAVVSHRIAV